MRNIWRIFCDDLRYVGSSIVSILVTLSLCLAPVMYAWVQIEGNWDPYGNTKQLKVAVANNDTGYESALMPVRMNMGERVVNTLRGYDDYDWTFVGEREALEGVRSGEYYAAIVVPDDFSSKIMSVLSSDDNQTDVTFYLNMKENPVAPLIAGEGGAEVDEDIRAKFTQAVDEMTLGLASDLVSFSAGNNAREFGARLVAHLDKVAGDLDAVADQLRAFSNLLGATSSFTSAASQALSGAEKAADATGSFLDDATEGLDAAISSARSAVSDINQQVKSARSVGGLAEEGTDVASDLASSVEELASSVDSISREAEEVSEALQQAVKDLSNSSESISWNLDSMRNDLGASANKLNAASAKIRKFQDEAASAIARGSLADMATIAGEAKATLAQWLADPVQIEKQVLYPVENFGSFVAPLYTVLSIWLTALALVLMMKPGVSGERLSRYEEQRGRPVRNYEQYLGRSLVFVLLTLLQATIVGVGDLLFLHIQCAHPLLFMAACWVCAIVFSILVYTLALSFGKIGKALCLLVLVLQVVGLFGGYPVQMMPDFFQAVNLLLPTTHGVHALQATVAGIYDAEYAFDLLLTAAFLAPSLILGLALRRPLTRLGNFFESKLAEADFM